MSIDAYRTNTNFLADSFRRVDVDFVELDIGELLRELLKDRANDPARATPSCPKVEDGDLVLANLCVDEAISCRSKQERFSRTSSWNLAMSATGVTGMIIG